MPWKIQRKNCCLYLPKPTIQRLTCFGESRNEGAAVVRSKSNTGACRASSKITDFSSCKIFN